jgi:hypothetical protein
MSSGKQLTGRGLLDIPPPGRIESEEMIAMNGRDQMIWDFLPKIVHIHELFAA